MSAPFCGDAAPDAGTAPETAAEAGFPAPEVAERAVAEPTEADIARFVLAVVDGRTPECTQAMGNNLAVAVWLLMVELMMACGVSAAAAVDYARLHLAERVEGMSSSG